MVSRVCEQCGEAFEVRHASDPKRFCSRTCKGFASRGVERPELWKRETVTCVVCGKDFERGGHFVKGQARRPRKQTTCSEECGRRIRYRHGRVCNELSPTEAAYLAGVWDSDGNFILHGRYDASDSLAFRVQIGVTKAITIDWIVEKTGLGYRQHVGRKNPSHADIYHWQVNGDGAESFIRQIMPYLVLKRPRAELGIEFQERLRIPALKADRSWQTEYRDRMRELNKRGR